jgi:hypothetical protein
LMTSFRFLFDGLVPYADLCSEPAHVPLIQPRLRAYCAHVHTRVRAHVNAHVGVIQVMFRSITAGSSCRRTAQTTWCAHSTSSTPPGKIKARVTTAIRRIEGQRPLSTR